MKHNIKLILITVITTILIFGFLVSPLIQTPMRNYEPDTPIGSYFKEIIVGFVGEVGAAAADYQCNGTDDHVQWQQALDALPAGGGKIIGLAGDYDFGSTVSRAINNVVIEGLGRATYFANDASTPLFSAGSQTGWVFSDLATDAGWLTLATDSLVVNCWNNEVLTDTHAELTTGVHGAGSDHLALAPAASHLVRGFTKGWTSGYFLKGAGVDTDLAEVYLPEFDSLWFHTEWTNNPEVAGTIWTVAFGEDGDIPYWAAGRLALTTGATINGYVRVYTSAAGMFSYGAGLWGYWATQWGATDRTDSTVYLGIWINTDTPPIALTSHHVGFMVLNGSIYATNADGTTEKATDTGIDYTGQYQNHDLLFIVKAGSIEYYVDGVLKATHTENLPSISAGYIYNKISNEVGADRRIEVKSINIRAR